MASKPRRDGPPRTLDRDDSLSSHLTPPKPKMGMVGQQGAEKETAPTSTSMGQNGSPIGAVIAPTHLRPDAAMQMAMATSSLTGEHPLVPSCATSGGTTAAAVGMGATVGGAALAGVETGELLGTIGGPVGMAVGASVGAGLGAVVGGIGWLFGHH